VKTERERPAPSRRQPIKLAVACLAAVVLLDVQPASAEVRSSTATRFYSVGGTTQAGLAANMRSNPFRNEGGGGVANMRPNYSLSVTTAKDGAMCQVKNVNLSIDFVMTLPKAKESAMSSGTLSAWRDFVSFARRHEQGHRSIYMQCAHNFLVKAQALAGPSCGALKATAERLLDAENRACGTRHAAYDRSERRRIGGLALFRTATANR
jgi:predicted secreted Zn-dependent protease